MKERTRDGCMNSARWMLLTANHPRNSVQTPTRFAQAAARSRKPRHPERLLGRARARRRAPQRRIRIRNVPRAKGKKARKPETTDSSNDKSSAEKKAAQKSAKASKRSRSSSSESASPPAKGEKPKREQKTARSSTPEPAGPAAIQKSLVAAWSLAEIQAFEAKAQEQTVAADGAALEAREKTKLVKALPVEIQRIVFERAGLRSTAEDEALQANADRLSKHAFKIAREAHLAWAQAALEEDAAHGNIRIMTEEDTFARMKLSTLPEAEQAKWKELQEAGEPETLGEARGELLQGVWDKDAVSRNYERALEFGKKFKTREPKKEAVQDFLALFGEDTLRQFDLPALKTFEKRKASKWATYCSVAYTLAWMIFKAHCDVAEDETS